MSKLSKRDHLVKTALELFNKHGFHAVGIDAIVQKAQVSKKTLYNHFHSKNELILATLRYYDETSRNFYVREVEKRSKFPAEQLLAIFDIAEEVFNGSSFYGCVVVKAIGEFSEIDEAIRRSCEESKRLLYEYIEALAKKSEAKNPEALAKEICLLLEGAIVMAQVSGDSQIASLAKSMAKKFIDEQIGQTV